MLDSGFFVSKGIISLLEFGFYAAALINNRKYWNKGVPGDATDQYFAYKDVTYVDMLEDITEEGPEGKEFNIFCLKEPAYVMKIMATWMTLNELYGADTRREYKGWDGQSLVRQFKYRHPSGLKFRYCHQVDDHNNIRHAPISIERIWATKLCRNINFAWYLAVTEVNMRLADGHFCKCGQLIPTLQFLRKLAHQMMENTIEVETVDSERPRRSTYTTDIVLCKLLNIKNHEGSYDKKAKKNQKPKQEYQKQRYAKFKTCNQWNRSFCKYTLGLFLCNVCFVEHTFEAVINA